MKLSKASLIAIISVLELARDTKRHFSTVEIASKHALSNHHLAKVLGHLVREGILQPVRGGGGGYRFTGNPDRTTLLDIIQRVETSESYLDVTQVGAGGNHVIAELQSISHEIDTLTKAVLDTITLSTVAKNITQHEQQVSTTLQ